VPERNSAHNSQQQADPLIRVGPTQRGSMRTMPTVRTTFARPTARRALGACAIAMTATLALAGCAGSASGSSGGSGASASNCFLKGIAAPAAPNHGGSANAPVTISFMETMVGGSLKPALQTLTTKFEAANPNITVDLEPSPDYGTLETNERNAVGAHKAPTIGQAYEGVVADFARSGVIDPLNSYVGNSASTLYKGVRDDLKLCDGNTWSWPISKSVYVGFYNRNMLAGAAAPVPTTWDQFASTAKAVSKNGVTAISIDPGGVGDISAGEIWLEILSQSYGTPVFDSDGLPRFNSAAAVKAMRYLADLKSSGALATGKGYPGSVALGAGKGLFDIVSVAGYSYEQEAAGGRFTLGAADLPSGPAGAANQMSGGNLVIFSQASPAQKQAAWKYLAFLSSAASQAYWSSTTGYVPVTPQALSLMTAFTAQNPWMITAASALRHSAGSVPAPWGDKAQYELGVALADVLQGNADPKAALDTAQQAAVKDVQAAG
jgi:ABC-type glycerol-3-phosphate transport system substrate-binding protein